MRLLDALKTLEAATMECRQRAINTAEVHGALDAIEPYIKFSGYVKTFRLYVFRSSRELWLRDDLEQVLTINFQGIHGSVRLLLQSEVRKLSRRYARTQDETIKLKIDRLSGKLTSLPEHWNAMRDGNRLWANN
jgi:hypothetical protein